MQRLMQRLMRHHSATCAHLGGWSCKVHNKAGERILSRSGGMARGVHAIYCGLWAGG